MLNLRGHPSRREKTDEIDTAPGFPLSPELLAPTSWINERIHCLIEHIRYLASMDQVGDQSTSSWDPNLRGSFSYEISGFRSLQNFRISLKPGLNILLGANGSGKTNFIDFLDFITELSVQNAPAAISSAGGIARVFSQETLRKKIPRITAKICGIADLKPFYPGKSDRTFFNFEYEIDIRYSKFHTAVYIAHEKIKFKNLHYKSSPIDCSTTVGSLEIHRRSPLTDETPRWKVGTYLKSNAPRNPLRVIHRHRTIKTNQLVSENDARLALLQEPPNIAPDQSLLSSPMAFPAIDAIRMALSRSRSFNLNPHVARSPDDISTPPVIKPNGNGLYSLIYQMQQAQRTPTHSLSLRRRFPKAALETITAWTQIVIPDLEDITATADPHTGKYLVYLHVRSDSGTLKIPLQNSSDGTLKWLAYVCLVVSHGSEYTFEEPENYLHPKMQQFFISLLRDNLESDDEAQFILSTHSETIINQCTPEELILFFFEDGLTRCKRVTNVSSLIEQVNQTGFGLGYYYTQNVVR